jgi:hypothetical protein
MNSFLTSDSFFRRILDIHIEPFPPLADTDDPEHPVPLLVLCLPFTEDDQLRYADRHKLAPQSKPFYRRDAALHHLRQTLPRLYTRWVTIENSIRAVVLATNQTKSNLALGFNLDILEKIRRHMGVPWIPTWNLPDSDIQETIHRGRVSIEPSLINWPDELPVAPSITWKDVDMLTEPEWEFLWRMVQVRVEVHLRVKGGPAPSNDTPMCFAFQLDKDGPST